MANNKTIHFIPPLPLKREKRIGIYCPMSTTSRADQRKSLTAQVSALTRLTTANPKWLLEDVYIDIASSKIGSLRSVLKEIAEVENLTTTELIDNADRALFKAKVNGQNRVEEGEIK